MNTEKKEMKRNGGYMSDTGDRLLKKRTVIAVTLIVILLCIVPVSAITVTGLKYMNSIPAGGTDTHEMTITLDPDATASDVMVSVMGFGQGINKEYSPLEPSEDVSPYSARSFISLDNSTLHLTPGITQKVTATLSPPQNTGAGGRYAIIYIYSVPAKGQMVTTGMIVPVMITIRGTTPTLTGEITGVTVGDIIAGQPVSVTTTLKNTGNHHYYRTVNTITIADTKGNILSNSSTSPSTGAVIPGNTVRYVLKPDATNLQPGTYTLNSKILLEDGTVLDEKKTTLTVKSDYVPPVTESNITLTPGTAGTLTSPDGRYSVSFPQGAVLGDAVVTLKPYSKDLLRGAPAHAKPGATCFEITGLTGLLSKDATVTVVYSADDLAAAGGDPSQLKLAYYDAAQNAWVILPTQVDTGSSTLTTTTNHLSVWAVMVSSSTTGTSAPTATSSVSAPLATTTKETPLPLTLIVISLGIAGIVARFHIGNRK
jgi:hypothetical protein